MLYYRGYAINTNRLGGQTASKTWRAAMLVHQQAGSCFGSGGWIDDAPWLNDEGWNNGV
ncbi:MAG: MFS transporter [Prevotella sp.]|nr:MFS transporter [Prevotella sp.]